VRAADLFRRPPFKIRNHISKMKPQSKQTIVKNSRHLKSASQSAFLGLTVLVAGRACATDGYFDYGYGTQAKGTGERQRQFRRGQCRPENEPEYLWPRTGMGALTIPF
jgi:hypothetical protein